ncbi:MAG: DUF5606 domain-containing protein [Bacteroidales bacterium]|nr:DUF5606 domain-containing protein [Bacteroidales bacterium]
MKLKDIVAISGEPGLFRFIAQGKNSIVVENLETGKRTSAFGSAKVSSLEDISVFTDNEDMLLGKVFDMIHEKENGGPSIDPKAGADELKNYFGELIPEYSRDKVYLSDIRKIVKWYNILHEKDLLVKDDPEPSPEAAADTAPDTEKESAPAPGISE